MFTHYLLFFNEKLTNESSNIADSTLCSNLTCAKLKRMNWPNILVNLIQETQSCKLRIQTKVLGGQLNEQQPVRGRFAFDNKM
jgi:hypothetical protein